MPFPRKLQVASLPRAALGTRIIIRPGEDGGVITLSEFLIAELASDERFRKMTTNKIIAMLKRDDFAIGDIRTDCYGQDSAHRKVDLKSRWRYAT